MMIRFLYSWERRQKPLFKLNSLTKILVLIPKLGHHSLLVQLQVLRWKILIQIKAIE